MIAIFLRHERFAFCRLSRKGNILLSVLCVFAVKESLLTLAFAFGQIGLLLIQPFQINTHGLLTAKSAQHIIITTEAQRTQREIYLFVYREIPIDENNLAGRE